MLRNRLRVKRNKNASPSVGLVDSQSIKTTKTGGECRGIDGGKKIKGRKRHIVTDTQGLLLAIEVHAAKGLFRPNTRRDRRWFGIIFDLFS